MSPKKIEIDNRNTKAPLVHRFMTSNNESAPQGGEGERIEGIISAEDDPQSGSNAAGELLITEVGVNLNQRPARVDYNSFITDPQDKIDMIADNHIQTQKDMKAQLKAELMEEIKTELKNELSAGGAPVKTESPALIPNTAESRYTFHNTMEDIVMEEVTGFLRNEKNICKCSRCVNDICAITLNALQPHYVTSEVGEFYNRAILLDISRLNEVTINIFKAMELVRKNPSHPL